MMYERVELAKKVMLRDKCGRDTCFYQSKRTKRRLINCNVEWQNETRELKPIWSNAVEYITVGTKITIHIKWLQEGAFDFNKWIKQNNPCKAFIYPEKGKSIILKDCYALGLSCNGFIDDSMIEHELTLVAHQEHKETCKERKHRLAQERKRARAREKYEREHPEEQYDYPEYDW